MISLHAPILLVDDNDDDILFMRRALQRGQVTHPIQVAQDGQHAIDYLGGHDPYGDRRAYPLPCLVLLDLKMPRVNGHEVLRWARAQPVLKSIVIVVLSTSQERADIEGAYREGANAYLVKPSAPPELITMVQALKSFWLDHNQTA